MSHSKLEKITTVNNLKARFYRDDVTSHEMIEISWKGNLNADNSIQRVTMDHIQKWPAEYQAFKQNTPEIDIGGTPLLDLAGMVPEKMRMYKLAGIRNLEELAAISDATCSLVGLGAMTDRSHARNHLAAKQLEQQAALAAPKRGAKQIEAAA